MTSPGNLILDFWGDWLWFAGAAMAITTVLVSLVYMLSELLLNDKMKIWAKMELVEIFYSAVIISLAIFGLPIIDEVVNGALTLGGGGVAGPPPGTATSAWIFVDRGPGGGKVWESLDICGEVIDDPPTSVYHNVPSCHMRLAIWYLRTIFNEAKEFAFEIYLNYIFTSMVAEFTINIEFLFEKAGFFTFTPWKGFFTVGNTIKAQVFDWAIKVMMLTKFQEVMLRFISTALFPALFVIGAILRTFAFTRRLGGLLLAMALGLYFIFPAFYSFGALVMLSIKNDPAVVAAWRSPTNLANPAYRDLDLTNDWKDYPDPPIANTMYMLGDFSMVGGDGRFSTGAARGNLSLYEGSTSEDFFEDMEDRDDPSHIQFDLTDDTTRTEQETNDSYRQAYERSRSWFNNVSQEGKYDSFVDHAWEPNGPIAVLSKLTFWSVFFSLFSIIGTIAGIRSLSMTFGGDIEIAGLTRLI